MPQIQNLVGRQFGALFVLAGPTRKPRGGDNERTTLFWTCRCECGRTLEVRGENLHSGHSTRCKPCAEQRNIARANAHPATHAGRKKPRKFSEAVWAQMAEAYQTGESTPKIAERFGADVSTVCHVLQQRGIVARPIEDRGRVHALNQDAFAAPLSDEAAYWVGFLMADGCVMQRAGSKAPAVLTLSLQRSDSAHVEKFRAFLGSSHPLQYSEPRTVSIASQPPAMSQGQCSLSVFSGKLCADLARCGIVPRKSLTATPVPELLGSRHFWRGMVDGDGAVFRAGARKQPVVGLCGSPACCEGFTAFARTIFDYRGKMRRQGLIFYVRCTARGAEAVLGELYQPGDVALARKAASAAEIAATVIERAAAVESRRVCSIPGCGGCTKGLGYCSKHLKRFRKWGDPNVWCDAWGGKHLEGASAAAKPVRKRRRDGKPDGFLVNSNAHRRAVRSWCSA